MLLGFLGWTEFCNFSFTPSCHISLHLPLFLIFLHILLVRPAAVNNDPIYIYIPIRVLHLYLFCLVAVRNKSSIGYIIIFSSFNSGLSPYSLEHKQAPPPEVSPGISILFLPILFPHLRLARCPKAPDTFSVSRDGRRIRPVLAIEVGFSQSYRDLVHDIATMVQEDLGKGHLHSQESATVALDLSAT